MTVPQTKWEDGVEWVGIVAGCVIGRDGKYLLVQEKQQKVYGLWGVPAGFVDKGETIPEAAVREVKEESGYDVELGREIGVYHESTGRPVKHIFEAQIVGGELKIQAEEILDAKWLTYTEIEQLKSHQRLRAPWLWDAITEVEQARST
jgi:8-oxo-dGTP diphosphatase